MKRSEQCRSDNELMAIAVLSVITSSKGMPLDITTSLDSLFTISFCRLRIAELACLVVEAPKGTAVCDSTTLDTTSHTLRGRRDAECLFLSSSLDGLHQPEASSLDSSNSCLLLLLQLLVRLLQLGDRRLEGLLGLGELLLLLGDLGSQVVSGQSLELLDLGLLGGVAEVDVDRRAHWLEVLVSELLQGVEVAASLVVLHVARIAVFDGGEPAHTVAVAERLASGSAVHVTHESALVSVILSHKFVPSRLHRLAVASPRGEELHEHRLSSGLGVPVCGGKLGSAGSSHCEGEEDETHLHLRRHSLSH